MSPINISPYRAHVHKDLADAVHDLCGSRKKIYSWEKVIDDFLRIGPHPSLKITDVQHLRKYPKGYYTCVKVGDPATLERLRTALNNIEIHVQTKADILTAVLLSFLLRKENGHITRKFRYAERPIQETKTHSYESTELILLRNQLNAIHSAENSSIRIFFNRLLDPQKMSQQGIVANDQLGLHALAAAEKAREISAPTAFREAMKLLKIPPDTSWAKAILQDTEADG